MSWYMKCDGIVWPMLDMDSNKTLKMVHSDLKMFKLYKIIYHTLLSKWDRDVAHSSGMNGFVHSSLMFQKLFSIFFHYITETALLVLQEVFYSTSTLICIVL